QGTLTGKDDVDNHPNDQWFQYDGGTIKLELTGPQGTDFDLQLMKWNGQWQEVAKSTSSSSVEQISYVATSGYYQIRVSSYSGSGDYTLTLVK
ncbi:MAG: peptidase, partial [Psychrosphaera sp.]|nr:peptidase [Psychrosphaera sp.]